MSASALYMGGLTTTIGVSVLVVAYLRTSLANLLTELCGSRERASFWSAFSGVTLVLTPLIFALQRTPEFNTGTPAVMEFAAQLKWALLRLLLAVLILGWVLSKFIRVRSVAEPAHPPKAD